MSVPSTSTQISTSARAYAWRFIAQVITRAFRLYGTRQRTVDQVPGWPQGLSRIPPGIRPMSIESLALREPTGVGGAARNAHDGW